MPANRLHSERSTPFASEFTRRNVGDLHLQFELRGGIRRPKPAVSAEKQEKSLTSGEAGHYILSTVARSFQPFRFGTKFTDDRKTECAKEFGTAWLNLVSSEHAFFRGDANLGKHD